VFTKVVRRRSSTISSPIHQPSSLHNITRVSSAQLTIPSETKNRCKEGFRESSPVSRYRSLILRGRVQRQDKIVVLPPPGPSHVHPSIPGANCDDRRVVSSDREGAEVGNNTAINQVNYKSAMNNYRRCALFFQQW
jgi:hypothetical protein